jgi:crotonobetainyl-CoA:carnitine CoA-transferase CaiB-like acyl-CoA transferase
LSARSLWFSADEVGRRESADASSVAERQRERMAAVAADPRRQAHKKDSRPLNSPLSGCRVLDLSDGIAGGYLSKLLRDAGAEVVKAEPPGGSPLRSSSANLPADASREAPLWNFLAGGTRSIALDPGRAADRERLRLLLEAADVAVETFADDDARSYGLDFPTISGINPKLILVSISSFGRGTSWRGRPATEFTLQAWSGGMGARGLSDREPLCAGGRTGDWTAGVAAMAALLASLRRTRVTGRGEHLDVSELEALTFAHTVHEVTFFSMTGRPYRPQRGTHVPGIEPTKDGLVGFFTLTGQQWQDFCIMIDRPDWLEDASLLVARNRLGRYQELSHYVAEWTRERTTAEIVELASAFRIPVTEIGSGESIPGLTQVREREMLVKSASGVLQPASPYLLDPRSLEPAPPPSLGADTAAVEAEWSAKPAPGRPSSPGPKPAGLPFAGLRVCDLTAFWAGPVVGQFFASLGAEVIHVEAIQRLDGIRLNSARALSEPEWWEWSPMFHGINAGKRDLTLDLASQPGLELAKRLIKTCDVVLENFTPRVIDHFGLTYDVLSEDHPELIMVRMPAFGSTGPWRDRPGFAQTIEQASGLAWITGYPDTGPEIPVIFDAIAGLHAMVGAQLALLRRDRTGKGQLVEAPMYAGALNIAAEQIVEWGEAGVLEMCSGNRAWFAAPQGVYPCARGADGEEGWIAISVESDPQWQGLVRVLGSPSWALDPALSSLAGRRDRHDDLDARLAEWSRAQQAAEVADLLAAAAVPAAPVVLGQFVDALPPMRERGYFTELTDDRIGTHPHAGFPVVFSEGPAAWVRTPAPSLGQDNDDILGGLGLSAAEIQQLRADRIIGEAPSRASGPW